MAIIEHKAPREIKSETCTPEPIHTDYRTVLGSRIQCQPLKIGRLCKGTSVCLSAPCALAAGCGTPRSFLRKMGKSCVCGLVLQD